MRLQSELESVRDQRTRIRYERERVALAREQAKLEAERARLHCEQAVNSRTSQSSEAYDAVSRLMSESRPPPQAGLGTPEDQEWAWPSCPHGRPHDPQVTGWIYRDTQRLVYEPHSAEFYQLRVVEYIEDQIRLWEQKWERVNEGEVRAMVFALLGLLRPDLERRIPKFEVHSFGRILSRWKSSPPPYL